MNILRDDIKILVKKLAIPASVGTLFQTLYNRFKRCWHFLNNISLLNQI